MNDYIIINDNNVHESLFKYIINNNIQVNVYEDIQDVYVRMIQGGFCFTLNRDILVDILTDIVYVLNPMPDNRQKIFDVLSQDDIDDDIHDDLM